MITDNNRKATILAYYFSKFDRDAMLALGYNTLTEAFSDLSNKFGKDNNYLKLRRDEFDSLTGSHRVGFHKRNPNAIVETFHNGLKNYSFEELSTISKELLNDVQIELPQIVLMQKERESIAYYTESELEQIINAKDSNSSVCKTIANINRRIVDSSIPNKLKELYQHKCQICGETATVCYNVDVSEAHHIDYFISSLNNNANNIIILCPDHHRILHKTNAPFNKVLKQFEYPNRKIDTLMYNVHL